jgi:hypothetical protein
VESAGLDRMSKSMMGVQMRPSTAIVALGLAIAGLAAVQAGAPPGNAPAQGRVTLLGTLAEWQYPGSKLLGGASMSDGGNPLVPSVKCQAILTTADPVEKVVAFYSEKLGIPRASGPQDAKEDAKGDDAKSVSSQDDSRGRPVAIRVIVVHKAETSTTLVISRAAGEEETHIAWSHYLRLDGKR